MVECQRAGLKKSAFEYAVTLMRSEYRSQIDPKYVKKIEAVIRKAPKGIKDLDDETETETSPCPKCDSNLQDLEVNCYQCKITIPICIASVSFLIFYGKKSLLIILMLQGKHIVKHDMVACPECDFPAIKEFMLK